jgi:signal transduction histidine kinase
MLIQAPPRAAPPAQSRAVPRTLPLALVALAGALLVLGGVEVVLLVDGPVTPTWALMLFPFGAGAYAAAGLLAWWRRPSNRTGAIMVAGAVAWLVAGLTNTGVTALVAAGLIAATVPLGIVVHLMHAFPSGRLRGRLSRATVVTGYVVCFVLQAPTYLFGPANPLQIADRHDLARAGFWLQTAVGAVVMAVTATILARRLRQTPRAQRWVLGPLYVYAIFAVLFVPLTGSIKELFPWGDGVPLAVTQIGLLAVVPIVFTIAALRGGFARTSGIEELGEWLGAVDGGRAGMREALAGALGDSSVALLFWVPQAGGYVDADGRPSRLPADSSDRDAVEVATAGRRVGAIVYDATLIPDRRVVEAAGRVIALALDHERLTAELRASREGLRRSRGRLVEAEDRERRRIARDLHDGLQTRLVLLAVEAARAGDDHTELRAGLEAAIAELRELVQGVMPAALTQGGIYAAAEDLADRSPLPVELDLTPGADGVPTAVETTAWFVLSEAVTNAVKHAGARGLYLSLGEVDGCLRIEVADDGIGGASAGAGAGLRGMADRVEAHNGLLTVESPPGGGTRVIAEVPCGS